MEIEDNLIQVEMNTPPCPRGHGYMYEVNNTVGRLLYHQCKNCNMTDEYPTCISCNEEHAYEREYCSNCILDLIDDYSEYL